MNPTRADQYASYARTVERALRDQEDLSTLGAQDAMHLYGGLVWERFLGQRFPEATAREVAEAYRSRAPERRRREKRLIDPRAVHFLVDWNTIACRRARPRGVFYSTRNPHEVTCPKCLDILGGRGPRDLVVRASRAGGYDPRGRR